MYTSLYFCIFMTFIYYPWFLVVFQIIDMFFKRFENVIKWKLKRLYIIQSMVAILKGPESLQRNRLCRLPVLSLWLSDRVVLLSTSEVHQSIIKKGRSVKVFKLCRSTWRPNSWFFQLSDKYIYRLWHFFSVGGNWFNVSQSLSLTLDNLIDFVFFFFFKDFLQSTV